MTRSGALWLMLCGSVIAATATVWALANAERVDAAARSVDAKASSADDDHAPVFTPEEIKRILQHSPLPDAPPDPTNRVASDPAAARLGQFLFFETRLSRSGELSCATCHDPAKGFSDGRQLAQGLGTLSRHSQALWNVANNRWFFWDGRADSLWSQALVPIEHQHELGGDRAWCAQLIFNDAELRAAYEHTFGPMPDLSDSARFPEHATPAPLAGDGAMRDAWERMSVDDRRSIDVVFSNLGKAIAAYEAKIISRDAPFDVFATGLRDGDPRKLQAISDSAKRGLKIFVGPGNCRLCHTGPNFSDGEFHSVGVGTLDGAEPTDSGRYAGIDELKANAFNASGAFSEDPASMAAKRLSFLTNKPDNWGQFKTPSLRNVALTAPYMHQGQLPTLAHVIEHYSTLANAVQIGHHREKILVPLNLTPQEKQDLESFLRSLTSPAVPETLMVKPSSPSLPPEPGNVGSGR